MKVHKNDPEAGFKIIEGVSHGFHLIMTRPYKKGELIFSFKTDKFMDHPTYQTVQIGDNKHTDDIGYLVYMNHSCDPNVLVDTSSFSTIALKNIKEGDELSFFYPSTEWVMDRPFVCLCGSEKCIRQVAGALFLSPDKLSSYFINDHIIDMIAKKLKSQQAVFK